MAINKHQPHVFVLPEDDANKDIANGFYLDPALKANRFEVLPPSGGWRKVVAEFEEEHVPAMRQYPHRIMVLLIDFDDVFDTRMPEVKSKVPSELLDRVFILGAKSEPERLKAAISKFEAIGLALAQDCREETNIIWGHPLLAHNAGELSRLRSLVRPILFQ